MYRNFGLATLIYDTPIYDTPIYDTPRFRVSQTFVSYWAYETFVSPREWL